MARLPAWAILQILLLLPVLTHATTPLTNVQPRTPQRSELLRDYPPADTTWVLPTAGSGSLIPLGNRQEARLDCVLWTRTSGWRIADASRVNVRGPTPARPLPARRLLHHLAHHNAGDDLPA